MSSCYSNFCKIVRSSLHFVLVHRMSEGNLFKAYTGRGHKLAEQPAKHFKTLLPLKRYNSLYYELDSECTSLNSTTTLPQDPQYENSPSMSKLTVKTSLSV